MQDIASLEYEAREGDTGRREIYVVDLGWVPDQDPAGQCRLVLLCGGWDDVVCVYEDRDRLRVRDRLEAWLDCVARAPDRSQLARLLRRS